MKIVTLQALVAVLARLSKREKTVFYAAMAFIALTLCDRLVISPIHSKVRSLNEEIQQKESSIKKNLHILAQKERIKTESVKYASFLGSVRSEDEELTALLKEIERLASKSTVYLVDMKPTAVKDRGGVRVCLVNLNCEAQMEQIMDLMYNIESSSELLTIEKYQITPKSKESSVAKCSMSIAKIIMP